MAKRANKTIARRNALNYVNKLQKADLNLFAVYIFGSLIKGNFTEWSDIDIAIVSEDFIGDPVDDRVKLMKLRWDIDLRIEPHPFLPEDWNEDDPFVLEIKKNGEKII